MALQPCLVLLLFPLPLDAFVLTDYIFLLRHLLRAGQGSCPTGAAASLAPEVCHGWKWHQAVDPPPGAPSCSLVAMSGSFSSGRCSCP